MDIADAALRLTAATAAGLAVGLNRELHHKPTGMRTMGLVALASALVTMASMDFTAGLMDLNAISRVIQGVLTGIGFIGAGVILRDAETKEVSGLTTAATVWLTAALGIVCGLGAWKVALLASAITLLLLMFGGRTERALHRWIDRMTAHPRLNPPQPPPAPTPPSLPPDE
jgi:putative Mg2+ transporter-C (MgtC) family protein